MTARLILTSWRALQVLLVLFMEGIVLSAQPTRRATGGVKLPWSTTFACAEWKQDDGKPPIDGLVKAGGWKCDGTHEDQITAEANFPGGDGGKGFRHWEGDGSNHNGGGVAVVFARREPELWIRWYMRYEKGFAWKDGEPYYDKLFYIHPPRGAGDRSLVPEWMYGTLGFGYAEPKVRGEPGLWKTIMGGETSDGQWHYHEIHMKMDTSGKDGVAEWWVDKEKVIDRRDVDFGTHAGWIWIGIGSNQTTPQNGRPMALDYDDVAISNQGRIGPVQGRTQGPDRADEGTLRGGPAASPWASENHPPAAADPRWPQVREGHYIKWVDRIWNTRKPAKAWQGGDVGILGQHNGTGTYLGEDTINGGSVEFDVKFDAGYLAPEGGGKHFLEIMSWIADRSDREAIGARPWSRIELAGLGGRPRCIVWNYGSHFRGEATRILSIGPSFQPNRWYHIRFDWSYREPAGRVTIHVDDRSYSVEFEFVPKTVGPGRFFLFGHVETTQPEGRLHFRNFKVGQPH